MSQSQSPKELFWSRFADDFEQRNNYVAGYKEMEILKKRLLENENLGKTIELGCGDGVFTKTIAQNSEKVIATDWSNEMVEKASQRFKNNEAIEVTREDCLNLSFKNNSFDTIIMINLLHVIHNPEKALDECKRILKRDGLLIILSFTMQGMKLYHKLSLIYRYFWAYGKPPKESRILTTTNVKELLDKTGFKINNLNLIGSKMKSVYVTATLPEN